MKLVLNILGSGLCRNAISLVMHEGTFLACQSTKTEISQTKAIEQAQRRVKLTAFTSTETRQSIWPAGEPYGLRPCCGFHKFQLEAIF
eukprot:scaffold169114_cov22-Prasinocladus_malaysianus.AAC.1